MPRDSIILGLPEYQIKKMAGNNPIKIEARYKGPVKCPFCGSADLRTKGRFIRRLRHESHGLRKCILYLEARKYRCRVCGRYFNQRFPGIQPHRRSTEAFRRQVFVGHLEGICRKALADREGIGTATVERWFHDYLKLEDSERKSEPCPRILGIDEHFFTRRLGYATTFCDLKHHKVYDVALGRSEHSLESYLSGLQGKEHVQVVCMDLAETYRSLVRRHFPNARIVADRFHVIRLVNHHFLATWRMIDPVGPKNRGLLSLMRRHQDNLTPEQNGRLDAYFLQFPAFSAIYAFKQRLCNLLREKTCQAWKCRKLIPFLLDYIDQLKTCGFEPLAQLGKTIESWKEEISCMWRFSKNNGITEGFHNKMEMISRRAFGFRNFNNYRLRVRTLCA